MTTKRQSQYMKEGIEENRTLIKQAEGQILTLNRKMSNNGKIGTSGWQRLDHIPGQIAELQGQIRNWQAGIANIERQLPLTEQLEQIQATLEAQAIQKAADEQAQATQDRDNAMKNAALAEWTKAGGDPNGFAAAWPQIQAQIATINATQAGAAALASHQQGDPTRQIAADVLNRRYAHNLKQGA